MAGPVRWAAPLIAQEIDCDFKNVAVGRSIRLFSAAVRLQEDVLGQVLGQGAVLDPAQETHQRPVKRAPSSLRSCSTDALLGAVGMVFDCVRRTLARGTAESNSGGFRKIQRLTLSMGLADTAGRLCQRYCAVTGGR